MSEFYEQLLHGEQERLQEIASEFKNLLTQQETAEALRESVRAVAQQVVEMYQSSPDTEFIFVIGGKSRRLTETLLNEVANALPQNHPGIAAIKRRLKLNDHENKNMYGENTSLQTQRQAATLPPTVSLLGRLGKRQLVICDDAMETGRKVYQTLEALDKKQHKARYIVFSSPPGLSAGASYLRPKNWHQFQDQVIVGTTNQNAASVLSGISDLLSSYANVRLHKNAYILGQSVPTTIDTIKTEYGEVLRSSAKLLNELKSVLGSS